MAGDTQTCLPVPEQEALKNASLLLVRGPHPAPWHEVLTPASLSLGTMQSNLLPSFMEGGTPTCLPAPCLAGGPHTCLIAPWQEAPSPASLSPWQGGPTTCLPAPWQEGPAPASMPLGRWPSHLPPFPLAGGPMTCPPCPLAGYPHTCLCAPWQEALSPAAMPLGKWPLHLHPCLLADDPMHASMSPGRKSRLPASWQKTPIQASGQKPCLCLLASMPLSCNPLHLPLVPVAGAPHTSLLAPWQEALTPSSMPTGERPPSMHPCPLA